MKYIKIFEDWDHTDLNDLDNESLMLIGKYLYKLLKQEYDLHYDYDTGGSKTPSIREGDIWELQDDIDEMNILFADNYASSEYAQEFRDKIKIDIWDREIGYIERLRNRYIHHINDAIGQLDYFREQRGKEPISKEIQDKIDKFLIKL